MTKEESIKILKYNSNVIHQTINGKADPKEVEALDMAIEALEQQKTGKWIDRSGGDPTDSNVSCSLCNKWFHQSTNYCPNCGVKMEASE